MNWLTARLLDGRASSNEQRQGGEMIEDLTIRLEKAEKCNGEKFITEELTQLRLRVTALEKVLRSYDGSHALDQWDEDLMPSRDWVKSCKAAINTKPEKRDE